MKLNLPKLRLVLKQNGVTHDHMGEIIGCSRTSATNKLNGGQPLSIEELEKLAQALDMSVEELNGQTRKDNTEWYRSQIDKKDEMISILMAENRRLKSELKKDGPVQLGSDSSPGAKKELGT